MDFVALDIETTGFTPEKGGRIIEIGAVKVVNNQIVDEFSQLINPGLDIPKKITEITNITNEMVANAPSVNSVLQRFWSFIEGFTVVAHNATFDWDRFLKPGFTGINKYVEGNAVCSLEISKAMYGKGSNKLKDICERNGVELVDAHRAVADCRALALCLMEMSKTNFLIEPEIASADKVKLNNNHDLGIAYKVHKVNYWESNKGRKKGELPHRRFYVDLAPRDINDLTVECYPGSILFDINTKSWANKDFLYNLDYKEVEGILLKSTNSKDLADLYYKMRAMWKDKGYASLLCER